MLATAPAGGRLKLHTHHLVREDQQALYGFRTADELGFFELLLTVTGVGPKVALAIVGSRPVADLQLAIIEQDQAMLVSIPGIGKKLAERIIFELKEKVAAAGVAARSAAGAGGAGEGEVVAALQALGYSLGEARDAARAALAGPGAVSRQPRGAGQGRPADTAAETDPRVEHPCELTSRHGRLPGMTDDAQRILAADLLDDADRAVEGTLRPRSLDEYVGQREVKANLAVLLEAARGRGEAADHVLLYGPPGLGKTTLATIIARELGVNVRYTSGPAIERAGDLAAILTALDEHDVLFIDEVHRLNRAVEEILYPAMEDYALDVLIGKGPSARSLRLTLKPFTIVGATTRAGRISSPLRDRFGATYRLDFYDEADLTAIVERSAGILGVEVTRGAAHAIARRGRGTPRVVNRLLKRTRDHAQVRGDGRVDEAAADEALRTMEIDDAGLDATDRKLMAAIAQKFGSGPVGVAALAAVLSEEIETIEDVYEPYLLRLGFLDRTPQGRILTEGGRAHLKRLGYDVPPRRRPEAEMPPLWEESALEGAEEPS